MFVTAAAFYRRKGFFFFAVMEASFTVEKHFVTDTLAAIELHAPSSPVSTTETDKKKLYPLYNVLTVSHRLSDGLSAN
jgi:hypothetical protein